MSVKFFGQYLIERGEVDDSQLREAVELVRRTSLSVGEIAVQERLLSGRDAVRVNAQQRHQDRPFGELAVEMGLLTPEQLESVLRRQQGQRLYVGEALVQLGHLAEARLHRLLEDYRKDQAPYETGRVALPAWLADSPVAAAIVDLVPKLCLRVARLHAKVGEGRRFAAPPEHPWRARMVIRGDDSLEVSLFGDRDFAVRLAAGISGVKTDPVAEYLVQDGLCEFLNLVAGNATSALERRGHDLCFAPAQPRAHPLDGYLFGLVLPTGAAALVLARA